VILTAQEIIDAAVDQNLVPGVLFQRWNDVTRWHKEITDHFGGVRNKVVLDVGCGPLRGAVEILPELEDGHYIGIDPLPEYIALGHWVLEKMGLADKATLVVSADFEFPQDKPVDIAMAQSVFTYLSQSQIIDCVQKLKPVMKKGAVFVFTYTVNGVSSGLIYQGRMPTTTPGFTDERLFHSLAQDNGIEFARLTAVTHPTGQRTGTFTF